MKIPIEAALALLHEASCGTLATLSTQLPGYPYATATPFVLDEAHRPVFCVSALAEHTRNLVADSRTSLSVLKSEGAHVQSAARITLVGDTRPCSPAPDLVARYLRYQPEAEQYLALDFQFFCLTPARLRFIGGVGKMGWLEETEWSALPALPLQEEASLLKAVAFDTPPGIRLLGLDCFGIDYETGGKRQRQRFPDAPLSPVKVGEVLSRVVSKLS